MQKHNYLELLNEPQRSAVLQSDGPVMIIAGAGSGKTRVLTYRIALLLEKGVDPFNILALTFTNKAAKEMRERIEKVAGPQAKSLWMGTFHSIFSKILRVEADKLNYPNNFTIYDSEDSKSLIKSILKEMNLDDKIYKPGMVLGRISMAKNNLITAKDYRNHGDLNSYDQSSGRPLMVDIYEKYSDRCLKAGAMDFDDLLVNTHELIKRYPDVLNKYQQKFKYIMVDEFQDTNHVQYSIIKKLAAAYQNICIVGDDAQSIYAFRGATIKNILNFERDYPDLKVFKLEQNYRSTSNIVNAASTIIKNNKDQLKKEVWTDNPTGDKIRVIRAVTDNDEGKLIAESIFEEKMRNRLFNKDFAILYRTNAQSRAFEEALRKMNIPYKIYGGLSFYQRKEIKDLLAYFRLALNPNDEEALKRVINYPARGIGKTTIDRLILNAAENNIGLWEVLDHVNRFENLKSAFNHLNDFRNMIKSFSGVVKTSNAYDVAMHIARQTTLLKVLHDDKTVEGISRYENIVELLNGIKEFVEDEDTEGDKTLEVYMSDIALLTDADNDDEEDNDKVVMMTVHSAKGLEFPHVYVVGMEENLFPSQLSVNSRQDLEEERRLFYVAVTRAEKKLSLSYATTRFRFGNMNYCEPSRFIEEIDERYLQFDFIPNLGNQGKNPASTNRSGIQTGSFGKAQEKIGFSKAAPIQNKSFAKPSSSAPIDPNFVPEDPSVFEENQKVEHPRFGFGVIRKLEGQGAEAKATVEFYDFGIKQLILKFAKLRRAQL